MKITVYDGGESVGGNKIYVEENGKGVFLDFGMNFAKYGRYFEEFLRERSSRGVHDPLHLGLIPKLNVYRSDLIPSDVDLSAFPKPNVEAVLISHAHLDHCGNAGYLHESIPIVASSITLAVLKAMRDSGKHGIGCELPYHSPKISCEDRRILKSQSKSSPYKGRDCVCIDEVSEELREFLYHKPGRKKLEIGNICHISEFESQFDVKAYEVDHSIYGAVAYVLEGDFAIAYTGDFRLHGKSADKTRRFVKEAKNARIFIVEGTRANRGKDDDATEREVYENCLKVVEESRGLVIADFSPRNFERLETFKDIAEKTSRQLVVTAKDAYTLHAIQLADGVDRMKGVGVYKELKERKDKWETKIVVGKWPEAVVDPREINRDPRGYILCFSFYDLKHLLDIKPEGGTYIYSSSEAFNEEQEFDFLRLHNWLSTFGFKTCGFEVVMEGGRPELKFAKGFHASGHASREDLAKIVEEVDPEVVIPVHTNYPEWFLENFDNAKVLRNGETLTL